MEMAAGSFDFEKLSLAELDHNPHEIFRAAREQLPFFRRSDGAYLIVRANDVEALFAHPGTRQVEGDFLRLRGVTEGKLYDAFQNSMLFSNDEVHRNRRSPLTRQFAFRAIQEMRPRIRTLCNDLLDKARQTGRLDVKDEFATLVPAHTIASILGVDRADVPYFSSVVYRFARSLSHTWAIEELPDLNLAATQLAEYVEGLIEQRRRQPRDDFISDYVKAVDAAGNLSAFEEIAQLVAVIIGGSDTTRAAIVLLVSLLLQNPDQLSAVRRNEALVPGAVLESVRFEPSVASVTRFVIDDIDLDGKVLPKGSVAVLLTISAMRDAERYRDPDRFIIDREQARWHPAFGAGPHRCLGEALAKVELEESLAALLALPPMTVVGEYPKIHGHAGIRRVEPLSVSFAV